MPVNRGVRAVVCSSTRRGMLDATSRRNGCDEPHDQERDLIAWTATSPSCRSATMPDTRPDPRRAQAGEARVGGEAPGRRAASFRVSPLPLSARDSLLGGVLRLGEVEDVEGLVRKVLDDRLKTMGAFLNPTEYDDAPSYLIAEAWELWQRYDPSSKPTAPGRPAHSPFGGVRRATPADLT